MADLKEDVDAVVGGDVARFQRIVLATSQKLVRLAARITGSVEDGEDVVQEAYMKAYRALVDGRFDGRSRVETWLYRIVANTAIDSLRSGPKKPKNLDSIPEPSWDGAGAAEARVALTELDSLLRGLPHDQRIAIVLKGVEGLSSSEIAEITGTTEGAVEQRLVRARATLKEWGRTNG